METELLRRRKRLIAATAPRAVECLIMGDLLRKISLNEKERKGASFRVTWKPATRAPLHLRGETALLEPLRSREGAPTAPGPFPVRARRTPSRERPRSGPRRRRIAWIRGVGDRLLAEREDLAADVQDTGRRAGRAHRSRRLVERPALAPGAFVDAGEGVVAGDAKRRFFESEEGGIGDTARSGQLPCVGNAPARAKPPRLDERCHRRVEGAAGRLFPFEDLPQQSEELR